MTRFQLQGLVLTLVVGLLAGSGCASNILDTSEEKQADNKNVQDKPDNSKKDVPKKGEPTVDDPKKDDPKKDDPKKNEPIPPPKDGSKPDDPKKDDPKKDDPKKDDPKKDDPKKDDPKKDDPKKDDPKKDDPKKDHPKKDDPKKDDPKKDEPILPPLVWNFDKPFGQTWVTQVKQEMTIAKGKGGAVEKGPITFEYTITTNVTWTPDPKGETPPEETKEQLFTLKIDSVKVTLKVPGQEITVDSAGPDVRLPVAALVKLLDQASLKVKLELATMKAEVTGLDEVLQKLSTKDRPGVDLFLSKDALVRQVEAAFPLLPKKDAPTKTPKRKLAAGKLGSYEATTTYTYGEVKKKKVDLKSVSEWTFTPSADAVAEVKIIKAEPNKVKLAGVTTFDAATGLVEAASVQGKDIKQKLTLKVGSETLTVDVVLDYSFTITPREL